MHSYCWMDIDDMLDEIGTRESQLAELRNRLDELISSQPAATDAPIHNQQKRPLISCLPYEMLSSIFKNGPNDPSFRTDFSLSVSQVSRCWRGTAVQTPFLWSGISLLPWSWKFLSKGPIHILSISQSHWTSHIAHNISIVQIEG
jgi:hypothetical protein